MCQECNTFRVPSYRAQQYCVGVSIKENVGTPDHKQHDQQVDMVITRLSW